MSSRYAVILVKGSGSDWLMGTRRDNGKVNFPAGGINDGEEPIEGAKRELLEETGFKTKSIKLVGCYNKKDKNGKPIIVYTYIAQVEGNPNLENDPDQEFQSIYWANPLTIPSENLHIKASENSGIKAIIEKLKG
jgi:8-oxo-dGTP pyrophosphatase MutT (NUDIX family)